MFRDDGYIYERIFQRAKQALFGTIHRKHPVDYPIEQWDTSIQSISSANI